MLVECQKLSVRYVSGPNTAKFADGDKIQVKLTYDLSVYARLDGAEFTGDVVLKNGTPIFSDRYYCPSDYDWMNDRPGDESHSILSTAALHLVYKDHYGIHLAHGHDGSFNQYAIVVEDRSGGSIAKTFEVMQSGSVTAVEFIGDGSKLTNLPVPNDGKLTIQGSEGTVYGQFTANQAGDITVTIPEEESLCPKLVSSYFIDANKSGLWAGNGKICGDDIQKNMTLLIDNTDAIDELDCGHTIKVQMADGTFHEGAIIALRKATYSDGWVPYATYGWIEIDGLTEPTIYPDGNPISGGKYPLIDVNGNHTITDCGAASAIGDGELKLVKPDGTVLGTFTANQAHPTEIIVEAGVTDAYTKAESDLRFMPLDITSLPTYVP